MKRSRRYIAATLVATYASIFVFMGVNRATEGMVTFSDDIRARTSPEELANLRDFNEIDSRGDFILEVVQSPEYSITYTPPPDDFGNFEARVVGGTLILEGFDNRRRDSSGSVRVGMPVLDSMDATLNPEVHISGYEQDEMALEFTSIVSVFLQEITVDRLEIESKFVREISLDGVEANREVLDLTGGQTRILR